MNDIAEDKEEKAPFNKWKLIIPVAIGIGVSLYLLISGFNPKALASVHLSQKLVIGLLLGVATVIVRDFSFMYKLRLSTGYRLGWPKTLQTIIMWEFGAAVTPKLSESAFVLYVLKKSGLTYGRSTAVMMLNSFMDNLVFVTVFTTLYFILGHQMLALSGDCPDLAGHRILTAVRQLADKAWVGYVLMLSLCIFLAVALFIASGATKIFFYRLAELRFLHRFEKNLHHIGDEIELTSEEYKNRPPLFWIEFYLATFVNWSARYLLPCCLFYAFSDVPLNMLAVYARQYVLWIFLVIPTTPGSSGIAEISFIAINCDFMPAGLSAAIALIWRIYGYYLYLVAGMIVLPGWVAGIVQDKEQG